MATPKSSDNIATNRIPGYVQLLIMFSTRKTKEKSPTFLTNSWKNKNKLYWRWLNGKRVVRISCTFKLGVTVTLNRLNRGFDSLKLNSPLKSWCLFTWLASQKNKNLIKYMYTSGSKNKYNRNGSKYQFHNIKLV